MIAGGPLSPYNSTSKHSPLRLRMPSSPLLLLLRLLSPPAPFSLSAAARARPAVPHCWTPLTCQGNNVVLTYVSSSDVLLYLFPHTSLYYTLTHHNEIRKRYVRDTSEMRPRCITGDTGKVPDSAHRTESVRWRTAESGTSFPAGGGGRRRLGRPVAQSGTVVSQSGTQQPTAQISFRELRHEKNPP